MAGNKKPRKKYNPDKRPKKRVDYIMMANHTIDGRTLHKLNAPIDISLHRLHAGTGTFTDWANVWFRSQIALLLATNFYAADTVNDIKALVNDLEGIRERNVVGKSNMHLEDWSFTDEEFSSYMELHAATDQMHKDLHADTFLPIYRHANKLSTAMIDAFMAKYPPTPEQAAAALKEEAFA